MSSLIQDIRFGIRSLKQRRGFTAVAVLTLALGIGVNTALFTVFNAFVLKPLPLKDPGTLFSLEGANAYLDPIRLFSYRDYLDYRAQSETLSDVVAWNKVRVTLGEAPPNQSDAEFAEGYEYLFGQIVSGNYFAALGTEMALGRPLQMTDDERPGEHPVVVLSHGCWQRRFNSDPSIVGRTISLQGQPFTVVGVTSQEFTGTTPDVPSFWAPLMMRDQLIQAGGWGHHDWLTDRNVDVFTLLGRLKSGASRAQAESELRLITARLLQSYPASERKTRIKLESAATFVTLNDEVMPLVVPLIIGFGLVLLIACANVANLLLARASGRQRELGLRLALGASRARVVQQLVTESVLLALSGGAVGLLLATWTLRALYPLVLSSVPLPDGLSTSFSLNLTPDAYVFGFALLTAALAGIGAGLAPALQASKPDLSSAMKNEGSTFGQHLSQSRLRSALVVGQIAICMSLLACAGLLLRNVQRVRNADTGMTTDKSFSVAVGLKGFDGKRDIAREVELRRQLAERITATPGVLSVSEAAQLPLSGNMGNTSATLEDRQLDHPIETRFNSVSSHYFETLQIPLIRGRSFTAQEVNAGVPVAVISAAAAKRYWPGAEAIGKHIGIPVAAADQDPSNDATRYKQYEVIGVAQDARSRWVWEKDESFVYLPLPPAGPSGHYLIARTEADPTNALNSVSPGSVQSIRCCASRCADWMTTAFQMAPFRAVAWL